MPGLLTPERRQRAKTRARTSKIKTTIRSKIKKDKTKSSSKSPYQALSVDTDDPPLTLSSNFIANSNSSDSLDSNSIIVQQRQPITITPIASSDSPRRWKSFDESTTGSTIPYSSSESTGSPARNPRPSSNSYATVRNEQQQDSMMYASDEEMPMDEMMSRSPKKKTSPSPSPKRTASSPSSPPLSSPPPLATKASHKQKQSATTHRSATPPTKEASSSDDFGLSNIMALATDFFNDGNHHNTSYQQDGTPSSSDKSGPTSTTSETNHGTQSSSGAAAVKRVPSSSDSTITSGIQRIIAVLNSNSPTRLPPNLDREERILWDSLQTAMVTERLKKKLERRALKQQQRNLHEKEVAPQQAKTSTISRATDDVQQKYTTAMSIVAENQQHHSDGDNVSNLQLQQIHLLKQELQAKDALMKEKEESHTTEVLAIQRVLADVTTEKFQLEEIMEQAGNGGTAAAGALVSMSNKKIDKLQTNVESSRDQTEAAKREAAQKSEHIKVLESDLNDALFKVNDAVEENKNLRAESQAAAEEISDLRIKLEMLQFNHGNGDFQDVVDELKAEVSYQKLETEKLKVEKMESQVALVSASEEVNRLKTENELAAQEMGRLKRERDHAGTEAQKLKEEKKLAQEDLEKLKMEQQYATNELEELRKAREHLLDKAINEARAGSISGEDAKERNDEAISGVSSVEFEKLQQTLSVTTSSLETSKKIIASLENANGSLAVDSRSKLKEKEEELSVVQKESDERKRNLDSLATELRDLQRKQGDVEYADRRTKVQLIRQKALMDHLDSTLTDLQAAVVVHESSVTMLSNSSNIEEISEILGDALHAITATLETSEQYFDEVDDSSVGNTDVEYGDVSSEVGRRIDAIIRNDREATSRGLSHELDQKKVAVKRLEEALKKQNEEMRRVRSQFYNSDNNQLRTEIQRLRQQCTTNMEVLARKERELSVLRSSLKVDENESGYISDDASDDEDEDDGTDVRSILSAAKLNGYGPADAEAYATILSQANGRIEMPGNAQIQEIEALKRDLMEALGEKESASKELQARRESLANAKMIISSLEKANKGMMEDLRSRLEDSNTAISSLLDKSKESEKAANDLREKLQRSEQEKLEERENYEAELRKSSKEGQEVSLEEKKES